MFEKINPKTWHTNLFLFFDPIFTKTHSYDSQVVVSFWRYGHEYPQYSFAFNNFRSDMPFLCEEN